MTRRIYLALIFAVLVFVVTVMTARVGIPLGVSKTNFRPLASMSKPDKAIAATMTTRKAAKLGR